MIISLYRSECDRGQRSDGKGSKALTPVTLELGGKSPCVVEKSAKLNLTAKRIAFGKLLNCGQTCVAPDYILVERSVKDEFLGYLKKWIVKMYGENATENGDYVKIINQKHFDRVCGLIDQKKWYLAENGTKRHADPAHHYG